MSRSIHTTYAKNIRGLTKKEIDEQAIDPNSDLSALSKKSNIKNNVKKSRKQKIQLKAIIDKKNDDRYSI